MFETPETKGEQSGTGKWIGVAVVIAVIIGGVVFFMGRKNDFSTKMLFFSCSSLAVCKCPPANTNAH